jgi:hypothetical protein
MGGPKPDQAADDGATLMKERQTTDWRGTRSEKIVFRRVAGNE